MEHAKAVKAIGRYLAATKDKGLILTPNNDGLQCYADADFAGNWHRETAQYDMDTARSRSGLVIKYADLCVDYILYDHTGNWS
jgi:hypothetical protein